MIVDKRGVYVLEKPYYGKIEVSGVSSALQTQTLQFSKDEPLRLGRLIITTGARCSVTNIRGTIEDSDYNFHPDVGASASIDKKVADYWGELPLFEALKFDTEIVSDTTVETITIEVYGAIYKRVSYDSKLI